MFRPGPLLYQPRFGSGIAGVMAPTPMCLT